MEIRNGNEKKIYKNNDDSDKASFFGQGRSAKFPIFARWYFRHAALSQITTRRLRGTRGNEKSCMSKHNVCFILG